MGGIIWTLVVLLFVCWIIGFAAHVGGSLIHLLLVVAVIVALFNFFAGRSATRV
jgi:Family of unknown function (DUF5670)